MAISKRSITAQVSAPDQLVRSQARGGLQRTLQVQQLAQAIDTSIQKIVEGAIKPMRVLG
jgi:hypothetical protein